MHKLWSKAQEAAGDAQFLFQAGRHDAACNRAYYAMFNAARALLAHRGFDPKRAKTHATVLRLFSMHFVQTGLFGAEDGRGIGVAAHARSRSDYSELRIEREAIEDVMSSLKRFMDRADQVIRNLSGEESR